MALSHELHSLQGYDLSTSSQDYYFLPFFFSGVVLMMFLLPLVVYYLYFACNKGKCQLVLYPKVDKDWRKYFDLNALLLVVGWIVFQIAIYFLPVGRVSRLL